MELDTPDIVRTVTQCHDLFFFHIFGCYFQAIGEVFAGDCPGVVTPGAESGFESGK